MRPILHLEGALSRGRQLTRPSLDSIRKSLGERGERGPIHVIEDRSASGILLRLRSGGARVHAPYLAYPLLGRAREPLEVLGCKRAVARFPHSLIARHSRDAITA